MQHNILIINALQKEIYNKSHILNLTNTIKKYVIHYQQAKQWVCTKIYLKNLISIRDLPDFSLRDFTY